MFADIITVRIFKIICIKYLPLLIIILLFSCSKNSGNKKEYVPEQNLAKIDLAEQEIIARQKSGIWHILLLQVI
jgi:hypothetical protein